MTNLATVTVIGRDMTGAVALSPCIVVGLARWRRASLLSFGLWTLDFVVSVLGCDRELFLDRNSWVAAGRQPGIG